MFPLRPPLNSWFSCIFLWFSHCSFHFKGILLSWSSKKTSTLPAGWDTHMEFSAKLMNPLGAVLGEYLSETHVRIIEAWQNAEWLCVLEKAWKKATKTTLETMACMEARRVGIYMCVRSSCFFKLESRFIWCSGLCWTSSSKSDLLRGKELVSFSTPWPQ